MTKTPAAAAIYCRISRDADGEGLGVTRQEQDCRALADKLGWTVIDTYVDNSISAYGRKRRPEYERLLGDLASGAVNALVVWKPDRLHRSPVELERFIDVVERNHVAIATVAGGTVDLSTSEGRAMARVVGAFARMESEVKAERTRRKHVELAERGAPVGGRARPFGYDDDKITVRADERALVQEAAAAVLAGRAVRSIAKEWNDRGIVTPLGNRWTQTGLRRVLTAWRTAGVRALADEPIARGAWEPLLDADTHARLRALLLAPGRTRGGYGPRTHVLTGLLVCGKCGCRLIARPQSNRRRTYVCTSNPDVGGCGGIRIVADDLEAVVGEAVAIAIDSDAYQAAVAARTTRAPADDPSVEIATCETKLAVLAEQWAADEITRGEWTAARQALQRRLDAARRRQVTTSPSRPTPGTGTGIAEQWPTMTIDQRHALLAAMIETITINAARRGYNRFDSSRIDITWRV